ncbi:MAG TPA: hypothetical protein VEW03_04220 [Longimicrobiaceae bacterium]|nr:hypothetical protein [Longimicrobiaceae bacterium]
MDHATIEDARQNRNSIYMGLGAALVWLLIVGGIAFFWAKGSFPEGGEGHPTAEHAG